MIKPAIPPLFLDAAALAKLGMDNERLEHITAYLTETGSAIDPFEDDDETDGLVDGDVTIKAFQMEGAVDDKTDEAELCTLLDIMSAEFNFRMAWSGDLGDACTLPITGFLTGDMDAFASWCSDLGPRPEESRRPKFKPYLAYSRDDT